MVYLLPQEQVFPARYLLALLGFFGFFNVYAMRVNLSVAMVAMVRRPTSSSPQDETNQVACKELIPPHNNLSMPDLTNKFKGEFDWDSSTQGLLLGAFFYGYVITQIPGGILAEKRFAKWLFGFGVLITSILTLLTPVAARWNVWALFATRCIEGIAEGVTFPAMNALIGRWVPKMERSRLATLVYTGSPIGTVVTLSVSGLLCESDIFGGWPSVFYLFGAFGCIWFVFWMALVYETPEDHPRITKAELIHIRQGRDEFVSMNVPIPWKSILTSVPLWALAITHFGQNYGFYTLLTEMPTYLSSVLHFNLKKNGVLSSLPYLMQAFVAFFASVLADKLRATGYLKITTIRKVINSIAFFGPAICVLSIAFVGCSPVTIVILLIVALGFNGFMYSGFNVTHIDMSPELAGTLMGITNCIGNLSGFLAPAYVGWMTQNGHTLRNWGSVFMTTSTIYIITAIVYNVFCSAELQPWGTPSLNSQRKKNSF